MKNYKTAIITGASTGIGRALALRMAQEGYDFGLIARRSELLKDLADEIRIIRPGAAVHTAACDVQDDAALQKTIRELAKALGHLGVFVANAGIGVSTPAWQPNWPVVSNILKTNVLGAIASLEAAKEILLEQRGGQLVGISSVAAFRGLPASSAYCTSKAALTTYLESVRLDLRRFNIRVTSIHPGYIATPMTEKNGKMPFLLSADDAADRIYKAIQAKKSRLIFPGPLKIGVWLMRVIPNWLYDGMILRRRKKTVFN